MYLIFNFFGPAGILQELSDKRKQKKKKKKQIGFLDLLNIKFGGEGLYC